MELNNAIKYRLSTRTTKFKINIKIPSHNTALRLIYSEKEMKTLNIKINK